MDADRNTHVRPNGESVPAHKPAPIHMTAKPVADVYERDDAFVVALDLPGAVKDRIEVVVEPGLLVIRAGVGSRPEETGRWLHREISWNRFEREFKLGPGIDESRVAAEFVDGVLTVTLPKSESSRTKQIEIQ